MKKLILYIFLILLSFVPSMVFAQDEVTEVSKPTLYVREGCSHCAVVKEFLTENDLNDQLTIIETYNSEENQAELDGWFEALEIPNTERGVPFMVYEDGTKSLGGDTPIISYFAELNGIEVKEEEVKLPVQTNDTGVLVIGGIIMLSVIGYGIYSMFDKED